MNLAFLGIEVSSSAANRRTRFRIPVLAKFSKKIGQEKRQQFGVFMESSRGFSRDRRPGRTGEARREGFQS